MTIAALTQKLGGARVFGTNELSELEFIQFVRAGLPVESLNAMLASMTTAVFLQSEVFDLIGSARTLQRKRAKSASRGAAKTRQTVRLSPAESDRLARLARVVVRAEEAFGSSAKTQRWLSKPNRALEGTRPLELLDSDAGALAVERVLGRIEHGVFS